jgi:proline dehydrogenase
MLLGVPREKLQQELVAAGYVVRLYVPYAIEWRFATGYAKRRLAANPNMGLYIARNIVRQLFRR